MYEITKKKDDQEFVAKLNIIGRSIIYDHSRKLDSPHLCSEGYLK